jgi:hypothetical protein
MIRETLLKASGGGLPHGTTQTFGIGTVFEVSNIYRRLSGNA